MKKIFFQLTACISLIALSVLTIAGNAPTAAQRSRAREQYQNGNYNDAYEIWQKLSLDPKNDPMEVGGDLSQGIQCLRSLGRADEIDQFREEVIDVHRENWRLLWAAAQTFIGADNYGYIVAGRFYRGQHRGGGRYVDAFERDRVQALRLMVLAMEKQGSEKDPGAMASFYLDLARMLISARGYEGSWRLQFLTDLATLPDYEEGYAYRVGRGSGAPVNPDGTPVYYGMPSGFSEAENDGERWRWSLIQAMELSPSRKNEVLYRFADFLRRQFGVQSMADYGRYFAAGRAGDEGTAESGTYALHTLGEDETIAKLATGIKRFKLPAEFNFIKIYRAVADDPGTGYGAQALESLARIFEDRRQYDKSAGLWQRSIREYGSTKERKRRLDQILGNWGQFEPVMTQPDGTGATAEFRFRNGRRVSFEAHEIKVQKLLDDIKNYLKSNPRQLDRDRMNINNIGYRLVQKQEKKYIGKKVASWKVDLDPRPMHFDRRITITTPLQKAGAYLLRARMADGNISKIVIWIDDTVIVKKTLDRENFYFLADARSGAPISGARVEFFGFRQKRVEWKKIIGRRYDVITRKFNRKSDRNGQIILGRNEQPDDFNWLAIAETKKGRFAHLGFSNIWYRDYQSQLYDQAKVFTITDRPVYRPGQTVKFKIWIGRARYDKEGGSSYADQHFNLEIHNPGREKVFQQSYKSDRYGGFSGEFKLPAEANLGIYSVYVPHMGGGSFRVEEYKKPEFEVKVEAPVEPVMLGESITASIEAKYYFGAPVTKAKVKYKVLRWEHRAEWYPAAPWDWFYGPGYWWFAYDYTWYPGWFEWAIRAPRGWWWPGTSPQPEVVQELVTDIGEDGTFKVEIDTALAKEIHGDTDHRYEITAEVTDESRRTIVGKGSVLVARKPFRVYTWVDRGHYRAGDTIRAYFTAQTLDRKPVSGKADVKLFRISYKNNEPVETLVQEWGMKTGEEDGASLQIKASRAGQYRLSSKVTDTAGHTIEGGYLFVVVGEGFDASEFRFNNIELVTDKKEYAPGDTVRLMVNTDRLDSTVVLFLRPSNGVYIKPEILRLDGKSRIVELKVTKADMPNFFVEAFTVSGGKLHTAVREIIVPPEKRVLNVDVLPSAETYKPGEDAGVKIKLTDFYGEPFKGSAVVSVYDKAVEYISGGSNVPEIKAFFWKWRRRHQPWAESSLQRYFSNLTDPGDESMGDLGVFGRQVADELSNADFYKEANLKDAVEEGKADFGGVRKKTRSAMAPVTLSESVTSGEIAMEKEEAPGDQVSGAAVEPAVRTEFADTAFWANSIETDEYGVAEVQFVMPENLTGWKIRTWVMGPGTKVGEGTAEVVTTKNLLIRLQAPRFFVEKDEVVLSANIHNYLENEKAVSAVLELDGNSLEALDKMSRKIKISAGGEERVDWRVKVLREGEAVVRMKALSDEESDAMEMRFPVYVHGMVKTVSFSGAMRPKDNGALFTIDVPEERRVNESSFEIRYSPALAGAMVDALPYLAGYPYGCTEQTLNRFLPTVITQKILLDMGLDLQEIKEKRTNLNVQEIGDDRERAAGWKRWTDSPVFDEATLRDMVRKGLRRLTAMQLSDGGWGWFSGWGEHSYPHTTATVVHGLQVARGNDAAVDSNVLDRGLAWLNNYQDEQVRRLKNAPKRKKPWKSQADNRDALVYMVLVDGGVRNADMLDFLYRDRNGLSVYAKAMYGMALYRQGEKEKMAMVMQNIEQYLVEDDENQTAYLKLPNQSYWWYWYGSEYEAHAYYLKLLALTEPKSRKASRLVKYLLNNRKHATYWNSTRDTALCVEALADYLRASGEDKPDMTVEIYIDGRKHKEVKIDASNLFTFDNRLLLLGDAVEGGRHTVSFRKKGTGPLYFNAYLSYFSLEDFITRAGLEIKVNRKVYKLVEVDKTIKVRGSRGQAADQKVEKYERRELSNLDTLKSGDLVEVELELDSKNDYEYLVFEDMKAAGFEPVEVQSGYVRGGIGAYMELRDERVTFFLRVLPRGKNSVSYRLRAEIPGKFSAMPAKGWAMYAPELKANSDEIKLKITD